MEFSPELEAPTGQQHLTLPLWEVTSAQIAQRLDELRLQQLESRCVMPLAHAGRTVLARGSDLVCLG